MNPRVGLERLRRLAAAGELTAMCERHRIAVLTVFGSTATGAQAPRDLDIGVLLAPGERPAYLELIGDLQDAAGVDIDVAVLNSTGPLMRERALVGAVVLYEAQAGQWARAATAAALQRMDTAWMRRLDLELLAG